MDQPIVWRPDEERASRTHTARFMAKHGIAAYGDLYARSIEDPAWFWDAVVEYLGIPFITPTGKSWTCPAAPSGPPGSWGAS